MCSSSGPCSVAATGVQVGGQVQRAAPSRSCPARGRTRRAARAGPARSPTSSTSSRRGRVARAARRRRRACRPGSRAIGRRTAAGTGARARPTGCRRRRTAAARRRRRPGERTMSRSNVLAVGRLERRRRRRCQTWPWWTTRSPRRAEAVARRSRHGRRRRRSTSARGRRGDRACGLRPSARARARRRRARGTAGAGRSGRLLNSGWAWVPTQNGWPASSMNSTSRSSGDVPEQHEARLPRSAAAVAAG